MAFFWIKKAAFDAPGYDVEFQEGWRQSFELSGVAVVQMALATGGTVLSKGTLTKMADPHALWAALWLKEQHDRAQRKELLSMGMEAAILVLVLLELVVAVYALWKYHGAV